MQDLEAAGHVSSPIEKERVVNACIVSSLCLSVPPRIPLKEWPHPQYTDLPNLLNAIKIIPQSFPMACLPGDPRFYQVDSAKHCKYIYDSLYPDKT